MAARFLAATKAASRRLNAYPYSTSAPRSRSLMALGSPVPSISSLPGQYHRPILRRSFSSEERLQQQMDVLKNELIPHGGLSSRRHLMDYLMKYNL